MIGKCEFTFSALRACSVARSTRSASDRRRGSQPVRLQTYFLPQSRLFKYCGCLNSPPPSSPSPRRQSVPGTVEKKDIAWRADEQATSHPIQPYIPSLPPKPKKRPNACIRGRMILFYDVCFGNEPSWGHNVRRNRRGRQNGAHDRAQSESPLAVNFALSVNFPRRLI